MRGDRPLTVAVAALLSACTPLAFLTRPEGAGGWSPARTRTELHQLARRAGVTMPDHDDTPAASEPAGGPLSLTDVLELTATRSRRIAEAERQLAMAREQVWEERGLLLPRTTAQGQYTWYSDPQRNGFQLPSIPGAPAQRAAVVIREDEEGRFRGEIVQTLDLLARGLNLASAQAGYRAEQARQWATILEQELAAISAYYALLEAERLREVTDQTLVVQRAQLANADARFRNGRLTKNELLVVQVALRTTEQARLQRQLAIDQARWRLNRVVGLPVDAPTTIRDVHVPPDVPPIDEALRHAHEKNPLLLELVQEQQRLEQFARANVLSRGPDLRAGAAIDYTTADVIEPQRIASGFVGLTWDLGTDTRREARIARARLDADRNRLAIEAQLREIEALVRATHDAVAERLAALAAAEAAVAQAEENLRIRRQQFDAGRAASEDVLDADALLAAQRATRASALYQAHVRRAELQRLMGLPLTEPR